MGTTKVYTLTKTLYTRNERGVYEIYQRDVTDICVKAETAIKYAKEAVAERKLYGGNLYEPSLFGSEVFSRSIVEKGQKRTYIVEERTLQLD